MINTSSSRIFGLKKTTFLDWKDTYVGGLGAGMVKWLECEVARGYEESDGTKMKLARRSVVKD